MLRYRRAGRKRDRERNGRIIPNGRRQGSQEYRLVCGWKARKNRTHSVRHHTPLKRIGPASNDFMEFGRNVREHRDKDVIKDEKNFYRRP
jgi:hypothetical protein